MSWPTPGLIDVQDIADRMNAGNEFVIEPSADKMLVLDNGNNNGETGSGWAVWR